MKHNNTGTFAFSVPIKTERNKEDILTEFDYQMINEMKQTSELQNWSDEQLKQYCLILRTYTQIIYHVTKENSRNDCSNEKQEYKLPTIVSNSFLYQKSSLKSKIQA
jgi:hypothetical protein